MVITVVDGAVNQKVRVDAGKEVDLSVGAQTSFSELANFAFTIASSLDRPSTSFTCTVLHHMNACTQTHNNRSRDGMAMGIFH